MLFMVIENFRNGDAVAVGKRFKQSGRMLPEGVDYQASWVDSGGMRCFQIMQARRRFSRLAGPICAAPCFLSTGPNKTKSAPSAAARRTSSGEWQETLTVTRARVPVPGSAQIARTCDGERSSERR